MPSYKCKNCGATLHPVPGKRTVVCEYCRSTQIIPDLDILDEVMKNADQLRKEQADREKLLQIEKIYGNGLNFFKNEDYENAKNEFLKILGYRDTQKMFDICISELEKQQRHNEEVIRREIRQKKAEKNAKLIKGIVILAIIAVISLLIFVWVKETKKSYSPDNIDIQLTSKENIKFNEELAEGYVGAGYYYNLKFNVTNNSKHELSYLSGILTIKNSNDDVLAQSTVNLTGIVSSHSSGTWNVELNVDKGTEARELWNTQLQNLNATFRITHLTFNNSRKYYENSNEKQINIFERKENEIEEEHIITTAEKFANCKENDVIFFGKFEIDGNFENGLEDIPWTVMKITSDNKVLLMPTMSLIEMPWSEEKGYVSWGNSTVREYLNGYFYDNYFTDEEKEYICIQQNDPDEYEAMLGAVPSDDKIFILNQDELFSYYPAKEKLKIYSTGAIWSSIDNSISSISINDRYKEYPYWTRNAFLSYYGEDYGWDYEQGLVEEDGTLSWYDGTNSYYGVRPALFVDLNKIGG